MKNQMKNNFERYLVVLVVLLGLVLLVVLVVLVPLVLPVQSAGGSDCSKSNDYATPRNPNTSVDTTVVSDQLVSLSTGLKRGR